MRSCGPWPHGGTATPQPDVKKKTPGLAEIVETDLPGLVLLCWGFFRIGFQERHLLRAESQSLTSAWALEVGVDGAR